MNELKDLIEINCSAIEQTSELELMIKQKINRLKQVCNHIIKYQIKILNTAGYKKNKAKFSYMVSINLTMPEGFDLYSLRLPQYNRDDSIDQAISDAFAKVYRQLIELKLENS